MIKKIILGYLREHYIISIILLLSILGSVFVSLLPPLLLKYIIDVYFIKSDSSGLFIIGVYYFLLFLLLGIFDIFTQISLSYFSGGILYKSRASMINTLHSFSYKTLTNKTVAEEEIYFSNDVNSINELIVNGIVSLVINLFKIIGIIISIFVLSPFFGYISLFVVIVVGLIVFFVLKKMFKAEFLNRSLVGNVNSIVLETLDNIKTIKIFHVKDYIIKKYDKVLSKFYKNKSTINFFDSSLSPVILVIEHSIIVLVIVLFGLNGNLIGLGVGTLAGLISYITNLFDPIVEFGKQAQTVQYSISGIKRLDEYFSQEKDLKENSIVRNNKAFIDINEMDFNYDKDNKIFKKFNLSINKGEKIMLSGESGAGKTTLIKIIYGLIKPTSGSVFVNGIPAFNMTRGLKKQTFGVLFQDPFFSGESIYNEITFGEKYSREKIDEALKLCELDTRFQDLSKTLDSDSLSSGEKALFNLARLLLRNNEIIILDEVNSHIDAITYRKIINILNSKFKENTIISINHYGILLENVKEIRINKL